MSDFKGNKEVARQLILKLKCCACKDVPGFLGVRKNRYSCPKGHMICEDCKSVGCSCGSKLFHGPLEFVESIMVESQWHYCCYFKHGCQDMLGPQDLEGHQKDCIFREIVCLENKCKEPILFKDFLDHVDSDHKDWNNEEMKVDGKTFNVSFNQENISQNVLKYEATNFTQLSNNYTNSEPIYVQNLPWKIGVRTHVVESVKYLECSVFCDCKSKSYSCQANVEFRIINHKATEKTHLKKFDRLYESGSHLTWKYFEWNKVIEPEAGFLKNDTVTFEFKIKVHSVKGLNPNFPKICDTITVGTPTMLKTSAATFLLASCKQCDILRFWIYLVGSFFEAKHYRYTLSIMDKTGEPMYTFQGKVFTLDKVGPVKGSVFMLGTEDAMEICDEKSKFDVNITITNLKEEAKDDDEESGVSDGSRTD